MEDVLWRLKPPPCALAWPNGSGGSTCSATGPCCWELCTISRLMIGWLHNLKHHPAIAAEILEVVPESSKTFPMGPVPI